MDAVRIFDGVEYYLIDSLIYGGHTYHLWESEFSGEFPNIVTRGSQRILDAWNGFEDLYKYLGIE